MFLGNGLVATNPFSFLILWHSKIMAKQDYIARYFNIITKLSRTPYCSYEDLYRTLENEFEIYALRDEDAFFSFSKRTFQRDIREIKNILGIDIVYSRANKGYFIEQNDFASELFLKTVEQINSFNALKVTHSLEDIIHLEKTPPSNSDFLPLIIQAIQKKRKINFDYKKFGENEVTKRTGSPLALKEYKNRWYLIVLEKGSQKVFGLERMQSLMISTDKIDSNIQFDYDEKFQHCFGVISPNAEKPSKIILEFDAKQAGYVKTLPLHSSQKILKEENGRTQIELTIYITTDFVAELLSLGSNVKVLKPQSLINQLKQKLQENMNQYN